MLIVNHWVCQQVRRSSFHGYLICGALSALSLPIPALAQFTGSASATVQFESSSNVFDLPAGAVEPMTGSDRRSDAYYSYGAGVQGKYLFGQQQLFVTASASESEYLHLAELNHEDFSFDSGLIWKLGDPLDGKLDVSRTRSMVPFVDLAGAVSGLTVATDQKESLRIGLKFASDWKAEVTGSTDETKEPIAQTPDLQLTQTTGTASLNYLGMAALSSGITGSYLAGRYSDTNGTQSPSYSQTTFGVVSSYKVSRTVFDGQVGYSRRASSTGIDNASGLTALLDLHEQLTPKTSFTIKIDREINSYLPILGSELDTEASVLVDWKATYKLSAALGYTFTYRAYPAPVGPPGVASRVDYNQYASLAFNYRALRWLVIKPYANLLMQDSNYSLGRFNATVFGVSLTATTPE